MRCSLKVHMITIITVSEETLLYRARSLTERGAARGVGGVWLSSEREKERQADRQRDQNA